MRTYEVKLYTRKGAYKKTINPRHITSDIQFSEDINGGQGQLYLNIIGEVNDFMCSDIVEIREVDEENKEISPTYTGIVESVNIIEHLNRFELSIELLSISTALADIFYKQPGTKFNKSARMHDMAKSIIDYFNSQYGDINSQAKNIGKSNGKLFYYTDESIVTGTPPINREFDCTNCLDALEKIVEDTDYYWFIDATGCFHFKERGREHKFTLGRQVVSINRSFTKRELKNVLYHFRKDDYLLTHNDAGSIAMFGIKEESQSDTDILDHNTQLKKAQDFIKKKCYESNEVELILKPMRTMDLNPGDRISVNNIRVPIIDKQVTQVAKARDFWTIKLGDFLYFGKKQN